MVHRGRPRQTSADNPHIRAFRPSRMQTWTLSCKATPATLDVLCLVAIQWYQPTALTHLVSAAARLASRPLQSSDSLSFARTMYILDPNRSLGNNGFPESLTGMGDTDSGGVHPPLAPEGMQKSHTRQIPLEGQRGNASADSIALTQDSNAHALANQIFASGQVDSSDFDWNQVDIPQSLTQPTPPLRPGSTSTSIFPANGVSVGPPSRLQQDSIQSGRASWDGSSTASPLNPGFSSMTNATDDLRRQYSSLLNQTGQNVPTSTIPLASEGESSDAGNTSAGSTKRRRMTVSGADSLHESGRGRPHISQHQTQIQQKQQPVSPKVSHMTAGAHHRSRKHHESGHSLSSSPFFTHDQSSSGLVNSKQLEEMAAESLQRASAENRRTTDHQGHLSAMPTNSPPGLGFQHQRYLQQQQLQHQQEHFIAQSQQSQHQLQHHQPHNHHQPQQFPQSHQQAHSPPQRPALQRQRSTTAGHPESSRNIHKRYSGPGPRASFDASIGVDAPAHHNAHVYHSGGHAFQSIRPAHMGGSAASHPPGLGSSILKGQDPAMTGSAAANDFTRRKGWSNRVIDELLDFSHVLDPTGKILYATNSVQSLTGWTPSEIKGMSIYDIVHPQDLPALRRELQAALDDAEKQITLYYRIKRSPSQIAARAKTRLANASNDRHRLERSRSSSEATMTPTDSSSIMDPSDSNSGGDAEGRRHAKAYPAAAGELDPDAEWVTMEMTGHAYFPPTAVALEKREELAQQCDERSVPRKQEGTSHGQEARAEDDDDTATRSAGASRSNRGSLEEDRKSRGGAHSNASPPSAARTYELPLERETSAQCLFCSCRVYPTKSVLLLDSFLELKLENEKLRLELEQLNLNEDTAGGGGGARDQDARRPSLDIGFMGGEGRAAAPMSRDDSLGSRDDGLANQIEEATLPTPGVPNPLQGGVGEAKATLDASLGTDSTGPSSDGAGVGSTPQDQGADESKGVGTGDGGDGEANDVTNSLRKKKAKAGDDDEDRVCTDCGRTDSPEWRKGPLGPKTLCNACGLRYAKKVKRQPPRVNTQGGIGYQLPPSGSPDIGGGPSSLAGSPTQMPSNAMGIPMSAEMSNGGIGSTPMMSMGSQSRPGYSAMNSFSTESSLAGSADYRGMSMDHQASSGSGPPPLHRLPSTSQSAMHQFQQVPGGGGAGEVHYQHMPQFSQGYPPTPSSRPPFAHQPSSSSFVTSQDHMKQRHEQQQRQQHALQQSQQHALQQMHERHQQQLLHQQQQQQHHEQQQQQQMQMQGSASNAGGGPPMW